MAESREEENFDSDAQKEQESGTNSVEPPSGREELQKKYDELNNRFIRLAADFDNYRKRSDRDVETRVKFAIERFAVDLLEVVDNFDRALSADPHSAREGLEQIHKQFQAILERHGICPIEASGKKFNPEEHEAVYCEPSGEEDGMVLKEICCGFRMHDKVIRYAKVVVSKGKETE
ncbi:MAG TPA: nucleotide exchange factor GrpE [Methanolinea sp.]|jgi:molecular chaperone GrpE|nr:MAG: heat shock protein GrpE [Methanoregulaceae archaeon PtaB.Bin009]OPY41474.1 MAG: heat shock protein GrpE [Methanoregulaceae archaeon PtaU1.Bin066]HII76074.1 nucleotide exchange factor GrpE [Methanolinea sp.]HNQ29471.1 nucleotide exchange factor GrpE [Methanolinea sp.]